MKRFLLIVIVFFSLNTQSFGQMTKAYSSSLRQMFEASGTEETYKVAIKEMVKMFKDVYPDVDAKIWKEFEKEFLQTSLDDLVEMLTPVYSNYLTQSDLEELIVFYKTPVGKKFAKSTPQIMQESMQVGQEWGRKMGKILLKKCTKMGIEPRYVNNERTGIY